MNGCHCALVGRVIRPGELKYASTGTAMLRVSVLVEDAKRRDADDPVFANVTIWSERAEELADRLPKGATIYCEGKAKPAAWTAADGTLRCNLDISAWKAEVLGAIGKQAPRRGPTAEPVQLGEGGPGRRMPEALAVGGRRDTRQALGLDDDLSGWPE